MEEVIYESAHPTFSITTDRGIIQFYPPDVGDVQPNGMPYGEVNVQSELLRKTLGMTADEIRAIIKSSSFYTEDPELVGKQGVWPKHLRESQQQRQRAEIELRNIFGRLDQIALRAVIAAKKGKIPKNATHADLIEIAVRLHQPGEAVAEQDAQQSEAVMQS